MAVNLEQATRETSSPSALIGDLSSLPDPARRLWDQEVYSLDWSVPFLPLSEATIVRQIITDRMAMLDSELADPRCHFLSRMIQAEVHHQMRARPDYQTDRLTVEQWVPALRAWIVNGYWPWSTPASVIIATLQSGDPRRQTATDALADRRQSAASSSARNDAAAADRVLAAVDALPRRSIDQFIEVESALHSGDRITLHGDDLAQVEAMHSRTLHDARQGDIHAQSILTRGQQDDPTCLLPSTNPLVHRHGSLARTEHNEAH